MNRHDCPVCIRDYPLIVANGGSAGKEIAEHYYRSKARELKLCHDNNWFVIMSRTTHCSEGPCDATHPDAVHDMNNAVVVARGLATVDGVNRRRARDAAKRG